MVVDGVTTMTGMVVTDQLVQANYLKTIIQEVLTDQEVDVVIKHTDQDVVVTRVMKTGLKLLKISALKTGTINQIMISDAKNVG